MKAILKNYKQSPKKVRIVANALRGENVVRALQILQGVEKKTAIPMEKLILSAMSNAGIKKEDANKFRIGTIMVDQGIVLKRWMPRAMGRATPIRKRSSTISLKLDNE